MSDNSKAHKQSAVVASSLAKRDAEISRLTAELERVTRICQHVIDTVLERPLPDKHWEVTQAAEDAQLDLRRARTALSHASETASNAGSEGR